MGIKIYRKMMKYEFVYQDEATEYALNKLGITMKPVGKNNEFTLEQYEFIKEFTEWYFSGEWVEDELPEEDNGNIFEGIQESCYLEDRRK